MKFIFQLVIDKCKPFVRFGMMHLMATNICVVIVTSVLETAEDYRQQDYILKNVTSGKFQILIKLNPIELNELTDSEIY